MPRGRIVCFVVSIVFNGTKYYLMREEVGVLDPKTLEPIREAQGFFCTDLIRAKKWLDRSLAEIACSSYENDGARVEVIKTGEILK